MFTDKLFAVYFHKITYYLNKNNSIVIKKKTYISNYCDKHLFYKQYIKQLI